MNELEADPAPQVISGSDPHKNEDREVRHVARRRRLRRHTVIAAGVALVLAGGAAGFAVPRQARVVVRPVRKIVLVAATSPNVQAGAQITVTGAATVQGTPDTVNFSIGVHSTGLTATSALSDNNSEVQTLEHALESKGVTAPEMQTSSLDIYANVDRDGNVTGFSVDDDLDVTMHQVSDTGQALDAAASSVGNDVNLYGISFSISNTSALLATARAQAMANARTEAVQLASGAGLKLGPIVKVTDQENAQPSYFYGNDALGAAVNAASVPIERGTQPISVQVSVVYGLDA